tara:strand:- start:4991 stop:5113 length:123 start_codon:yes stop_codon:yes gene_type:complete
MQISFFIAPLILFEVQRNSIKISIVNFPIKKTDKLLREFD